MTAGEALDAAEELGGLWGVVNNAGINPYYHPVDRDPAVGVGRDPAGQRARRRGDGAGGRPRPGRGRRGRADRQPLLGRRAHRAAQHRPLQRLQGGPGRPHPHPGGRARPGRGALQLDRPGHDRHRDGRGPDDGQPGPQGEAGRQGAARAPRAPSPRRPGRSSSCSPTPPASSPARPSWSTAAAWPRASRADRRLRGRHGRLRRRGAPLRGPRQRGDPARGGPPLPARAVAGRAGPLAPDHQGDPRLGLPGARRGLAADRPRAARAGGGGLLGHQRRDRPARPPRALRRVGRPHRRLGLGELAALVPRHRVRPRLRRRALARRPTGPIPISRYPRSGWLELQERFCEAALAAGHGWVDDHNRPGRGRDRADPAQHGGRRPPDPGRPLPRPGAGAPQPGAARRGDRRPGRARGGRGAGRRGARPGRPRAPGRRRGDHGPRHLRHPGGAPSLGGRPARRARPPRHRGGRAGGRGRAGDAGPPEGLLPLRARPRRPGLAGPLVPVPADRRPRGGRRAARLPGDALLGHRRGRPALHRPERPGRRRPLAPGDRAPAEPRPARPAGHRDGLVPRALGPGRGRRGRGGG